MPLFSCDNSLLTTVGNCFIVPDHNLAVMFLVLHVLELHSVSKVCEADNCTMNAGHSLIEIVLGSEEMWGCYNTAAAVTDILLTVGSRR